MLIFIQFMMYFLTSFDGNDANSLVVVLEIGILVNMVARGTKIKSDILVSDK